MPRYNHKLATRKWVNRRLDEEKWSAIQRVTLDFQNIAVTGGDGDLTNLTSSIKDRIVAEGLWTSSMEGTDGELFNTTDFRIVYFWVHLRCALGESESTSAVSQTVRCVVYRSISNLSEGIGPGVTDVDGGPRYFAFYGDLQGYYWDKMKYVHSWATDSDTTAGGQVFFFKKRHINYTDTLIYNTDNFATDTEKGSLCIQLVGDDPDGTNASVYGFVEVGFQYREE